MNSCDLIPRQGIHDFIVPVKMHMLEDHTKECISAQRGDQLWHDGETRCRVYRKNVKKLELVMKEHLVSINCSATHCCIPDS